MTDNGFVGLVIVSHSASLADGVADLVGQVAGPDVRVEAIGGGPGETLGSDGLRVFRRCDAARRAPDPSS